jgi:O-acetyl-ADP-ribose deacetylase (regulator of RNase III)/DNA-binding Xre family transcriptional regulator
MAIKFTKGNIFTSKHQTLVNTINCVGVMGAGIALEFKYRYPKMYDEYVKLCQDKYIRIGSLWLYRRETERKWVLNFPTKLHWKFESKPEYLIKGLEKFVETYKEKGIESIAFPLLGADKGGLSPELSKEIMERYLSQCDIPIEIYEFDPYAEDDLIHLTQDLFSRGKPKDVAKTTDISLTVVNKIKKALEGNINSLSQLAKVKGIGETTLEKLYQIVLHQTKRPKVITQELFDTPKELNGTKTHVKLEKKEKLSDLPFSEKVALTGLDVNTVFNIEHEDENVTIKDLKTYCRQLKINPKHFIDRYFKDLTLQGITT